MKCAVHTEVEASGFCRNCGKALCAECTRDVRGILYCEDCLVAQLSRPQPVPDAPNPGLALGLGFIPGLGAVYNGEYMKALIHLVIFGGLIALTDRVHGGGEALIGLLTAGFYFYMPIEAYRTAKARSLGQKPPGILSEFGTSQPVGAFVLIGLGVLFLLNNMGLLNLEKLFDYWPVVLIILGILMLRKRVQGNPSGGASQ